MEAVVNFPTPSAYWAHLELRLIEARSEYFTKGGNADDLDAFWHWLTGKTDPVAPSLSFWIEDQVI